MNTDKIIEEAKWVVLLCEQANTNNTVFRLGSRGEKLVSAVQDLRKSLEAQGIDPNDVQGDWSEGYGPTST